MSIKLMAQVWEVELTRPQQSVLLAMADHANDQGERCFPSIPYLAWKTDYSERQIKRILKELRDEKILIVVREATHDRPTEYRICLHNARPKAAFRGDILSPPDVGRGDTGDTPGVTFHARRGDIAMSHEPSLEPPIEPSRGEIARVSPPVLEDPPVTPTPLPGSKPRLPRGKPDLLGGGKPRLHEQDPIQQDPGNKRGERDLPAIRMEADPMPQPAPTPPDIAKTLSRPRRRPIVQHGPKAHHASACVSTITHFDPRKLNNGKVPEGTGANAVEVYFEFHPFNPRHPLPEFVMAEMNEVVTDLPLWREVLRECGRRGWQPSNLSDRLDVYRHGFRNGAPGPVAVAAIVPPPSVIRVPEKARSYEH